MMQTKNDLNIETINKLAIIDKASNTIQFTDKNTLKQVQGELEFNNRLNLVIVEK